VNELPIATDQIQLYLTKLSKKHKIPSSHNLHSTITKKLQKYADLKEQLLRIWQMKMACIIPLLPSTTDIIPNNLHKNWLFFTLL
jgi:hypothetical protein